MGKALGIIALVLLILVASCVGCLYVAYQKTTGVQDDLYSAVNAGDPAKVKAMFQADLAKTIDDAQLAAWVKAVNEQLGTYDSMAIDGIQFNMSTTSAGEEIRSEGTVEFEKGKALSIVRKLDDRIVGLHVESDKPGVNIHIGDPGERKSKDDGGNAPAKDDGPSKDDGAK